MFAASVLVFMAGGWLLDRWLGLTPLFTILGAMSGVALASVSIYHKLELGGKKDPTDRARGKPE